MGKKEKALKGVIESSRLGISDKLVMIAVYLNGNETCEEMSDYLGMSRVMVWRIMSKMEEMGYVRKSQLNRCRHVINLWNPTGKLEEESEMVLNEARKLVAPIE